MLRKHSPQDQMAGVGSNDEKWVTFWNHPWLTPDATYRYPQALGWKRALHRDCSSTKNWPLTLHLEEFGPGIQVRPYRSEEWQTLVNWQSHTHTQKFGLSELCLFWRKESPIQPGCSVHYVQDKEEVICLSGRVQAHLIDIWEKNVVVISVCILC